MQEIHLSNVLQSVTTLELFFEELFCFITIWYKFSVEKPVLHETPRDPCYPSPCGPNANCINRNGSPSCSCLPDMIGAPPNCRPECVTHSDCSNDKACVNKKCSNPCINACGLNAECKVSLHIANCICQQGYTGDPFTNCYVQCEFKGKNVF